MTRFGEVHRQRLATRHGLDAFVGSIAARQHLAIEQQQSPGFQLANFSGGWSVFQVEKTFLLGRSQESKPRWAQIQFWRVDVDRCHPNFQSGRGVAAQLGIMATGLLAAWVGYILILTSSTVVKPPKFAGSALNAFTFITPGRHFLLLSWLTFGSFGLKLVHVQVVHQAFLAINSFQRYRKMPMPTCQVAPASTMGRERFSAQSTTLSPGLSMTILLSCFQSRPLWLQQCFNRVAGSISVKMTAGMYCLWCFALKLRSATTLGNAACCLWL